MRKLNLEEIPCPSIESRHTAEFAQECDSYDPHVGYGNSWWKPTAGASVSQMNQGLHENPQLGNPASHDDDGAPLQNLPVYTTFPLQTTQEIKKDCF